MFSGSDQIKFMSGLSLDRSIQLFNRSSPAQVWRVVQSHSEATEILFHPLIQVFSLDPFSHWITALRGVYLQTVPKILAEALSDECMERHLARLKENASDARSSYFAGWVLILDAWLTQCFGGKHNSPSLIMEFLRLSQESHHAAIKIGAAIHKCMENPKKAEETIAELLEVSGDNVVHEFRLGGWTSVPFGGADERLRRSRRVRST